MSSPAGRDGLLATVQEHLASGRCVAMRAPAGQGKTTFLQVLSASRRSTFLTARPSDARVPFGALASLFLGPAERPVSEQVMAELPPPQQAAVDALLRRTGDPIDPLAIRLAALAAIPPKTLLILDNAQWADPASLEVLESLCSQGIPLVVAGRTSLPLDGVVLSLPPLTPGELAELLDLPHRAATRIHAASGGNPALALALAAGEDEARSWLRLRLDELDPSVRATLQFAALAGKPLVALLERAGRPNARAELESAFGIVTVGADGTVEFTGSARREAIVDLCDAVTRRSVHGSLATATDDPVERARHLALTESIAGKDLLREVDSAIALARRRGDREAAAELELLAAELQPEQAIPRLVSAADDAEAAAHEDLVWRVARALFSRTAKSADRVPGWLAVIAAAGQGMEELDEIFARALSDAANDPALLAQIYLRMAIKANLADGSPRQAMEAAGRAAEFAGTAGDSRTEAMALTMRARMERILGLSCAEDTLQQALRIDVPAPADLRQLPAFLAARHAVFDDRLADARSALSALLPAAEQTGSTGDRLEILRGLAEVDARSGRCQRALDYAQRAWDLTEEAGQSPGPCWYTLATAELAGGTMIRARDHATRGAQASREEGDRVFLSRNLHVRGLVELLSGDGSAAVSVLSEVRELETSQEVVDPSLVRWHGDLACAYIATGRLDDASKLLEAARPSAERLARRGVLAALDRAQGLLTADTSLLHSAASTFSELGLVLEHGRTLLDLARVERRHRHRSTAEAIASEALALFTASGAHPWIAIASEFSAPTLSPTPSTSPSPSPSPSPSRSTSVPPSLSPVESPAVTPTLTPTEARMVELIRRGARNDEVAAELFISVKTVEGTLTRLYRKFGVRSRTELLGRL